VTDRLLERARAVLARSPRVDGHNDLAWALRGLAGYDLDQIDVAGAQPRLQTDIPCLRAGGVGAQFWSVYVPSRCLGSRCWSRSASGPRTNRVSNSPRTSWTVQRWSPERSSARLR
jgi:membrane dipeptidase